MMTQAETIWNPGRYESQHAFVWQYGQDLLQWLAPNPGDRILDLGCGTGQLTAAIAQAGAEVIGMDANPAMITTARRNYPHLQFRVADARDFQVAMPVDAVFSNAVLHWILQPIPVIRCVHQVLKSGGRFVAEFGGKGNVSAIANALQTALTELQYTSKPTLPWYFPSISEYTSLLENHGFTVTHADLFHRPTPLTEGNTGLKNWLLMFANALLAELSPEQLHHVTQNVEEQLKPVLYREKQWWADYHRLRVIAVKT
jgi:trans-aconitate 2-methyltransferase